MTESKSEKRKALQDDCISRQSVLDALDEIESEALQNA